MKSKLIDCIYRFLMSVPEIRKSGIAGGRLGAACFLLGYSELRQDNMARERGEVMLREYIMDIASQPPGLFRGKWGIIPAVRFLLENGIADISDKVLQLIENIRDEEFFIYGCVPVKIYSEDPVLTDAIILRDMHDIISDPLKKLGYRERLISYVEECEYLLTESFPPVFSPDMLSDCRLHSMTWFLSYAYRELLYPFKTILLAEKLKSFISKRVSPDGFHHWLLRKYVFGESFNPSLLPSDIREASAFINEAGFYSWLYRDHSIIGDLIDNDVASCLCGIIESEDIAWDDIAGLALGLISDSGKCLDFTDLNAVLETHSLKRIEQRNICSRKRESNISSLTADLTFCIPVRIDSRERLRNLKAVMNFFLENSFAKFIILEADSKTRLRLHEDPRIEYIFIEDNNRIFHRTHYINQMLAKCTTRYAAVWDTDVIVPRGQLEEALEMFAESDAVMVYPYDGMLWAIMEFMSCRFAESLNINILSSFPQNAFLMCAYHSVGGGFIVDKDLYRQLGWENENFTGWGPEDVERWKRLEIMGHKPLRTGGEMYHLNHSRGINSKAADPETMWRTRSELAKVCSMMPEELEKYIKEWNWIK